MTGKSYPKSATNPDGIKPHVAAECWFSRPNAARTVDMSPSNFDARIGGALPACYRRQEGRRTLYYIPACVELLVQLVKEGRYRPPERGGPHHHGRR